MKDAPHGGSRNRTSSGGSESSRSDTYDRLLGVTAELMIEKDSVEFSLAQVAQKSGMSAALVQYHFGSKDGLLMALLERGTADAVEQLVALERMDLTAQRKLKMHVRGLVAAYVKAPYINRLLHHMMNSGDETRAQHISEIFIDPVASFQRKLIDQGVAEGVFRPIDPMHLYFILVGACDHLVARRRAMHHAFGIKELSPDLTRAYGETVYEIIWGGIATDRKSELQSVSAAGRHSRSIAE